MNIDLEGRVNKTKYNVLNDRFTEIEIGFTKKDLTDIINENKQLSL
jgi:phage-related protein